MMNGADIQHSVIYVCKNNCKVPSKNIYIKKGDVFECKFINESTARFRGNNNFNLIANHENRQFINTNFERMDE